MESSDLVDLVEEEEEEEVRVKEGLLGCVVR